MPTRPVLDISAHRPAWALAPMPHAPLYWVEGLSLLPLVEGEVFELTPAMFDTLNRAGPDGEDIQAKDANGADWRLRRRAARPLQLWKLQSAEDSRRLLFEKLRAELATRLVGHIMHDLRNPMNGLSLHSDMLVQLVSQQNLGAQQERILTGARKIKERLAELQARQSGALALWLSAATTDEDSPSAEFDDRIADTLRLLRGYCSLHDIQFEAEHLQLLDRCTTKLAPKYLEVALLTAYLQACDAVTAGSQGNAANFDSRRLALRVACSPQTGLLHLILELQMGQPGIPNPGDTDTLNSAELIALMSLLLNDGNITISSAAGGLQLAIHQNSKLTA